MGRDTLTWDNYKLWCERTNANPSVHGFQMWLRAQQSERELYRIDVV